MIHYDTPQAAPWIVCGLSCNGRDVSIECLYVSAYPSGCHRPLTFGIYPGGEHGLLAGPPDDPERAGAALAELQGGATRFIVRCYDSFQDPGSPLWSLPCAPEEFGRYATPGARPMDLVLQYCSAAGNVPGYLEFVRNRIGRYAPLLYSVQITEEASFTGGPEVIDGPYPNVCAALTEGVQTARECLFSLGLRDVKVGFNSTPTFGPSADFWTRIATGGRGFIGALDYVGLDFFPDVFRRVAADGQPGDLASSVVGVLETMRSVWLPSAGISDRVPMHITEHGWPTSSGRSSNRQAKVIDRVVRTVHANSERLNVDSYSLFALRDVALPNSGNEKDVFHFFGIMTADYERKPAFETYRKLIQELGC
jgi:hypothetical protein